MPENWLSTQTSQLSALVNKLLGLQRTCYHYITLYRISIKRYHWQKQLMELEPKILTKNYKSYILETILLNNKTAIT